MDAPHEILRIRVLTPRPPPSYKAHMSSFLHEAIGATLDGCRTAAQCCGEAVASAAQALSVDGSWRYAVDVLTILAPIGLAWSQRRHADRRRRKARREWSGITRNAMLKQDLDELGRLLGRGETIGEQLRRYGPFPEDLLVRSGVREFAVESALAARHGPLALRPALLRVAAAADELSRSAVGATVPGLPVTPWADANRSTAVRAETVALSAVTFALFRSAIAQGRAAHHLTAELDHAWTALRALRDSSRR
jgi:hypothetical protein